MATLKNLTILVTRPKPQGEELCQKIQEKLGQAIYFPTIEIVPLRESSLSEKIEHLRYVSTLDFCQPPCSETSGSAHQSEMANDATHPSHRLRR